MSTILEIRAAEDLAAELHSKAAQQADIGYHDEASRMDEVGNDVDRECAAAARASVAVVELPEDAVAYAQEWGYLA